MGKTVIRGEQVKDSDLTVADLADGAVTLAKHANMASGMLIGRSTAGSGVPEEISIGSGLSLSGGSLASSATSSAIALTNNSGGTVDYGDVVIFDKANASSFKTTTIVADQRILGVAGGTILNGAVGSVLMSGIQTVNVTGNVALGQSLIPSATVKRAMANGGGSQDGLLGYALTAYAGGSTGTVQALIVPKLGRAGAAIIVEGASSGTNIVAGTNANRLVLAVVYQMHGTNSTSSQPPTVPTVGGVSMTYVGSFASNFSSTYANSNSFLYYYKAVGTGTVSVAAAVNANVFSTTQFIALSGVVSASYLGTTNQTVITNSTISLNCTDAVPGDGVISFSRSDSNLPNSHGAGQTTAYTSTATGNYSIDIKTATSTTETMTLGYISSVKSALITIPIRPA